MILFVNDETQELPEGATLKDLKDKLGIKDQGIAFARNEEVVPLMEHSTCKLKEQDRIIIIQATQGG